MGSFGSFLYINDFFGDEFLFGCPPSVASMDAIRTNQRHFLTSRGELLALRATKRSTSQRSGPSPTGTYRTSTVRPPLHGGVTAPLGPARSFARSRAQHDRPAIHSSIRVDPQHTAELRPRLATAGHPRLPLVSTLRLTRSRTWRASRVLMMTTTDASRRTMARRAPPNTRTHARTHMPRAVTAAAPRNSHLPPRGLRDPRHPWRRMAPNLHR